jgi:hypothetical protein
MNYNLIVKLNLLAENSGGRAAFQASQHGLVGGIPFHLKTWGEGQTITSFIVAPKPDFKFITPQEVIVPLLVESTEAVLNGILVGSIFDLWEGRVTAEGVVLERYF